MHSWEADGLHILTFSLAYCELYIALTAIALRVLPHMTLYQTTIADVAYDHDQLIALPVEGSKGVQVIMHWGCLMSKIDMAWRGGVVSRDWWILLVYTNDCSLSAPGWYKELSRL